MTQSEEVFERFLTENKIAFERVPETVNVIGGHRPDYHVHLGPSGVLFEVKERTRDENFGVSDPEHPGLKSFDGEIGHHVRKVIQGAKKQVRYAADRGIPAALVIYNRIDPLQMFGTDDPDFRAAMFGDLTLLMDRVDRSTTPLFHSRRDSLQENKNTSFSAVGRLCDRGEIPTMALFENPYAMIPLPFEALPPCLNVTRAVIKKDPVSFT